MKTNAQFIRVVKTRGVTVNRRKHMLLVDQTAAVCRYKPQRTDGSSRVIVSSSVKYVVAHSTTRCLCDSSPFYDNENTLYATLYTIHYGYIMQYYTKLYSGVRSGSGLAPYQKI